MNTAKAEKLWATASHPSTNSNEATNAFMMLRRALANDGGIDSFVGVKGGSARGRSDSEWADMYFRVTTRLETVQREHATKIGEIEEQHNAALSRAQRRVASAEKAVREKEAELAGTKAQGGDDLGMINQRNAENLMLLERLNDMKRTLAEAEQERNEYVAERVAAAEREIRNRVRASLGDEAGAAEPEPEPQPARRRRARASTRSAASAPSRKRPRASKSNGSGAGTENLVLDLLTNEWKCISRLYREARLHGFTGVENAIRWAAQRLADAGNAEKGHDPEGRIAYRRVI